LAAIMAYHNQRRFAAVGWIYWNHLP